MNKSPELIALAGKIALLHNLEPALVCAVIEQESEWNPWAMRYEPDFFYRYIAPLSRTSPMTTTESYMRAVSWGLMQVMGQVAREHGFTGAFLAELCDPAVGIEFGCRVLANRVAVAGGGVAEALLHYNGGADPQYPNDVLARVPAYQHDAG